MFLEFPGMVAQSTVSSPKFLLAILRVFAQNVVISASDREIFWHDE